MVKDRIYAIADHYGYEHQKMKLIEECSELIKAIIKGDQDDIMWECADVIIMIHQIMHLLNVNPAPAIEYKVSRQEARIKGVDCGWR